MTAKMTFEEAMNQPPFKPESTSNPELTRIKIEQGWRLYSADFSLHAANKSDKGVVVFIRDVENRENFHNMDDEIKDSDDGPPLYVSGQGGSIEEAIINANLAASHAVAIE